MVVVFDLDDTLYEELTYVKSGFRTVASFLEGKWNIPAKVSYDLMLQELKENGRGNIFNVVLEKNGILNNTNIGKALSVYRTHQPNIVLPQISIDCLNGFNDYSKYILTDGNKVVQHNKVKALEVNPYVKKVFITHRYGVHNAKPSPYCFLKIAALEGRKPNEIVYIGDNPRKDFVGIKKLGFRTVRILQGDYKIIKVTPEFDADQTINSLGQFNVDFLKKHFK
jgi:putative hydrolase of the HAD superfamily